MTKQELQEKLLSMDGSIYHAQAGDEPKKELTVAELNQAIKARTDEQKAELEEADRIRKEAAEMQLKELERQKEESKIVPVVVSDPPAAVLKTMGNLVVTDADRKLAQTWGYPIAVPAAKAYRIQCNLQCPFGAGLKRPGSVVLLRDDLARRMSGQAALLTG